MAVFDQIQDLDNLVGDNSVGAELVVKISQLLRVGKIAVEKQLYPFLEGRLLGEIMYVVAAVEQLSYFAVNEAGLSRVKIDIF